MPKSISDHYPRALPFQPPVSEPRKPDIGLRTYLAVGIATVLLSSAITGGVYFANRGGAAARPSDPTPRPPSDRVLETLGSLSAAHLYQSYLNIGLLADAVEKEGYSEQQANDMLATVVSLMNVVDKQLDKLAKGDLGDAEKRDVEGIRQLSGLLRVQVAALRVYWQTGDATRYKEARENAWTALSDVLGL